MRTSLFLIFVAMAACCHAGLIDGSIYIDAGTTEPIQLIPTGQSLGVGLMALPGDFTGNLCAEDSDCGAETGLNCLPVAGSTTTVCQFPTTFTGPLVGCSIGWWQCTARFQNQVYKCFECRDKNIFVPFPGTCDETCSYTCGNAAISTEAPYGWHCS